VSDELGGITTITVAVIIITGVLGNVIAESICRLFKIKEPVAVGLAIGTSSHAVGTAKALELAIRDMEQNYHYAEDLNTFMREEFKRFPNVRINSTIASVPFILNISIPGQNTQVLQAELDKQGFCLSTKSACCAPSSVSRPVFALTKDKKAALSTLRISISHLTTRGEIGIFFDRFADCLNKLTKQR
jgi:cysteine desulfurase